MIVVSQRLCLTPEGASGAHVRVIVERHGTRYARYGQLDA